MTMKQFMPIFARSSKKEERDGRDELLAVERALFGEEIAPPAQRSEIDTALQGPAGVACVRRSLEEGRPYALAFVDMRMPPGWDGLETIERLWAVNRNIKLYLFGDWTRLDRSYPAPELLRQAAPDRRRAVRGDRGAAVCEHAGASGTTKGFYVARSKHSKTLSELIRRAWRRPTSSCGIWRVA